MKRYEFQLRFHPSTDTPFAIGTHIVLTSQQEYQLVNTEFFPGGAFRGFYARGSALRVPDELIAAWASLPQAATLANIWTYEPKVKAINETKKDK